MNGRPVRTFKAKGRRHVTVIGVGTGKSLEVNVGDDLTIVEDHYGNTYVDGETYLSDSNFDEVRGTSQEVGA